MTQGSGPASLSNGAPSGYRYAGRMDSLCRRFRSLIGVDFSCSRRSRKTFGDLISKVKERAW
jgi:hypothetical protein